MTVSLVIPNGLISMDLFLGRCCNAWNTHGWPFMCYWGSPFRYDTALCHMLEQIACGF